MSDLTIASPSALAFAAGYLAGRAEQLLGTISYRNKCVAFVTKGKAASFDMDFLLKLERDINFDCQEAGMPAIRLADVFQQGIGIACP